MNVIKCIPRLGAVLNTVAACVEAPGISRFFVHFRIIGNTIVITVRVMGAGADTYFRQRRKRVPVFHGHSHKRAEIRFGDNHKNGITGFQGRGTGHEIGADRGTVKISAASIPRVGGNKLHVSHRQHIGRGRGPCIIGVLDIALNIRCRSPGLAGGPHLGCNALGPFPVGQPAAYDIGRVRKE